MKTLAIVAIILAVLSLYFIINAEKLTIVKGSEVLPAGTDIAKFILNKAKNLILQTGTDNVLKSSSGKNIIDASYPAITDKIKTGFETIKSGANNLIPEVLNKAANIIKGSIENKINETFCPAK